ncbi:MAG: hypothetical protein ACRDTX_30030 [Pseudonocardiaceae bacterium]
MASILVFVKEAEADLNMYYEFDQDGAFEEISCLIDRIESGEEIPTPIGIVGNGNRILAAESDNFAVLCRRLSPRDDPRARYQPVYLIIRIISIHEDNLDSYA